MTIKPAVLACAAVGLCACGSAARPAEAQVPPPRQSGAIVPPGYGTLRQNEVTVSLRDDALLIKVTPLDEGVIRLLAPDTYSRLHALAESRRREASSRMVGPVELFLVSFFSYQPDVTYQPENLQLLHQGRLSRPAAILPVTSGFGRQQLAQQENQSAIYVFDDAVDYDQPFTVQYGLERSADWSQIIPRLEVERSKVRAKAGAGPT